MRYGSRAQATRGLTLIEVLVAMVVIGAGMLTVLQLQTEALVGSQQASARSQAALLASAMADRMRSNPTAVASGDYTGVGSDDSFSNTRNCRTNTCNPQQLADFDVQQWVQQGINQRLPGGQGYICRDASPDDGDGPGAPSCSGNAGDRLAIKIWWTDDTEQQSADQQERYVLTLEPNI